MLGSLAYAIKKLLGHGYRGELRGGRSALVHGMGPRAGRDLVERQPLFGGQAETVIFAIFVGAIAGLGRTLLASQPSHRS